MKKRIDFDDLKEFDTIKYYDMPIFKIVDFLEELHIIDYEDNRNLQNLLTAKFLTIETEVTRKDIVDYLKPQLKDDVSIFEIMAMIDSDAFRIEKVKQTILINRIMYNVMKVSLKVENGILNQIVNFLEEEK